MNLMIAVILLILVVISAVNEFRPFMPNYMTRPILGLFGLFMFSKLPLSAVIMMN